MAADIVTELVSDEPDLHLDRIPTLDELLTALDQTPRAVVLLGNGRSELTAQGETLLRDRPHAKVLAIADGGRDTFTLELRPHAIRYGEVSATKLVDIIRDAAHDGAEAGT